MYPSDQERNVIQAAETLMVDIMSRYDPSHDALHVQRVRKTALAIARAISNGDSSKDPDLLTVELAALLHDVLDKKYVSTAEAADPYAFFLPFFQSASSKYGIDLLSDGRARNISTIISNVSWSEEKKLREAGQWGAWHQECLELHCVQDADRLDAIGAFGIMRCAAYSAATNRALHVPPGDLKEQDSAIQHFYDKLLNIHERLKTEPGRQMGMKRHTFLLEFLASVDEEYNATIPSA